MNLFSKPETKFVVLEIEKQNKLPEMSGELRESLKTLQHHPAFNYIIRRFRNHKAVLEAQLSEGLGLTETQMRYLQAGIFWLGQLERDINGLTKDSPNVRPATVDEDAEFRRVHSTLELVGQ